MSTSLLVGGYVVGSAFLLLALAFLIFAAVANRNALRCYAATEPAESNDETPDSTPLTLNLEEASA